MERGEFRPSQEVFQKFDAGLPGAGNDQTGSAANPFEEVARAFSLKREDTTPNPPFADARSVFEEEAPSSAQRRMAYDFYNDIASIDGSSERPLYLSPLDIVELHHLHLEAIRASVRQGEIVPEYTLAHVIGARKRLIAYTEAGSYATKAPQQESGIPHQSLQVLLEQAAHLEAIGYPLVMQREAVAIQQNLWEEARAFPQKTVPYDTSDLIGSSTIHSVVRYFHEEHPIEVTRKMAFGAVCRIQDDLRRLREGQIKRYGVHEALASATNFGHDDIVEYNLIHVLGAAKREVIRRDVQGRREGSRDTFTAYKLLSQGVENRQS